MQHISLFSGIGGFDLASEWMGWTNVASCEINPFGRKVLDYYWPSAYHHDDIHTLTKELLIEKSNWNEQEPTILTGGFPCQPYSAAGKRLGKEDERHLWPEMLRVIRSIRPRWVVGENVRGIISWSEGLVFEEVQADLEKEGYEVWAFLLPACGVDAPHRRDRVWFVAYRNGKRLERGEGIERKRGKHKPIGAKVWSSDRAISEGGFTPNPQHDGHATTEGWRCESEKLGGLRDAANTESQGAREQPSESQAGENRRFDNNGEKWIASDTSDEQLQRSKFNRSTGEKGKIERQSRQSCRPIRSTWKEFPTQPPICSRNDGIPRRLDSITFPKWRNESIKAAGNAIVPQVVFQIFKTIEEFESKSQ